MKKGIVALKHISISFRAKKLDVIKDISFELKRGEILAILGPSGCGKTTLLNAVSGNLDEKEAELTGKIEHSKGLNINTVFQESRLIPWRTVLDNVSFSLEANGVKKENARTKASIALKSLDLIDYAGYFPADISTGMKQRVNFARALVLGPDVLLLDEPFAALDSKTKQFVEKEFQGVIKKKQITSLFVTHSIAEATALADRIIVLTKKPTQIKKIIVKGDFNKLPSNIQELYG